MLNKPTQEGLLPALQVDCRSGGPAAGAYQTFPAAGSPIWPMNAALRLAQAPGIVGIKEATGNIERAQWLIKEAPPAFSI